MSLHNNIITINTIMLLAKLQLHVGRVVLEMKRDRPEYDSYYDGIRK